MFLNTIESYRKSEESQATQFAASLELSKEKVAVIDRWIESYIELKITRDIHDKQEENFNSLYNSLQKFLPQLHKNRSKYFLGRMIKIYDLMCGGIFTPIIDSSTWKLKEFIDAAFSSIDLFNPIEFTSLLAYLRGTSVDPNSEIFDYIWKIENQCKFFQNADFFNRNKALKYLLDLNGARGFHHHIKDFKRILKFIRPDNMDIIHYLGSYKVKNHQGCYEVIHFLFDDIKNQPYRTFQLKRDCIVWLDNALGSSPKKPWMDKLAAIQREITEEELLKVVHWILSNKDLEREQTTGWTDSVYKRFHKSSRWYLEIIKTYTSIN